MKEPISHPQIVIWPVSILHHELSEDLSKSHNFKNLLFCDVITSVLYFVFKVEYLMKPVYRFA